MAKCDDLTQMSEMNPRVKLSLQMTVDSVHHVNVPLRASKKMKKRKELDALVAHSAVAGKRGGSSHGGGGKRSGGGSSAGGGASSQDGLLSESTEDQDDYWVLGGGKGRGNRGRQMRRRACSSLLRVFTAVLVFACVIMTMTVMWLFIDIREQVTALRIELDQVAAGSRDIPDALQKCHSVSRELQQNQTALYSRLATLSLQVGNFSIQLTGLHNGLNDVEERLKAAPELVNVPQNLKDLLSSVATFGGQISDLDNTVKTLKDQATKLHDAQDALAINVTGLQASMAQALNSTRGTDEASDKEQSDAMRGAIAQLTANVTLVNSTLLSKLKWLVDDQHSDHSLIEVLQNLGQNVTARVTTLEVECAKETALTALNVTVKKLADNATASDVRVGDLRSRLSQLQSQYSRLEQKSEVKPSAQPEATVLPSSTPSSSSTAQLTVTESAPKQVPALKPPVTRQ